MANQCLRSLTISDSSAMTRTALIIAITIGIFLAGSCIDPYNPPEIKSSEPYLIVDGLVDVNSEDAHVVLIHSQALDEEGAPLRESNATVSILVNGSQTFMLSETAPGEYVAAGLLINPGDQCQLRIETTSGQEFLSEVVTSKETPAIDSITWTAHPDHLDIEVNTHDPTGSTLYYRWKYEQTVMYRSVHPSSSSGTRSCRRSDPATSTRRYTNAGRQRHRQPSTCSAAKDCRRIL